MSRLDRNIILPCIEDAQKAKLLDASDTVVAFYHLDLLSERLKEVTNSFGPTISHTVAVKANPLSQVLKFITLQGFGLECASFEEVHMAAHAGAHLIVWDSPAKTSAELKASNDIHNLVINANSLNELQLVLENTTSSDIGLRINPEIDTGSHASMSVAGAGSKFGESIASREEIISAVIAAQGRVNTIHVHSSSQTKDFKRMTEGIRVAIDLAKSINSNRQETISRIDFGGGFPASYQSDEVFFITEYANVLKHECPELFDGTFIGITEFGRHYHANAGFTTSLIADVKQSSKGQTIVTHAGADMFLREAYQPGVWPHEYYLLRNMQWVEEKSVPTKIGGPLCFGADYIDHDAALPEAEIGDWLIVMDTGANSLGLWSRHCSRRFPKVIGLGDKVQVIKQKESIEDILRFWE